MSKYIVLKIVSGKYHISTAKRPPADFGRADIFIIKKVILIYLFEFYHKRKNTNLIFKRDIFVNRIVQFKGLNSYEYVHMSYMIVVKWLHFPELDLFVLKLKFFAFLI